MMKNVLIIEDDKNLQSYLSDLLIQSGFSVNVLNDGTKALTIVENTQPDLVLLDLGLPTVSGESVCKEIKKEFPNVPITILTGKNTVSEKVIGFELGADDYITKPFASEELLARIRARLKENTSSKIFKVADLTLNTESMEVKRGTKKINLTPQEFRLLEYLLINKGRVLSREMLLNKIWSNSYDVETRVIDVYISYLRKKIDSGFKKKIIQSVRGFGYVVRED